MRSVSLKAGTLAVAFTLLAAPASAQAFWLDHETSGLSLEVLNPTPEEGDLDLANLAVFATAAVQIGEGALLVLEIPFSRAEGGVGGSDTETAVGNPYIGFRTAPGEATGLRWSAGVRIPIASDGNAATGVGLLSSTSDRFEAFIPDLLAVAVAGRYVGGLSDIAYVSGRLGAVGDVPTDEGDVDVFLQYGAKSWIESQGLAAGLGLSGRYLLTEPDLTFGDRTLHELGIWAEYAFGSISPGVRVQLPVGDQMSGFVDRVIGIYVQYEGL